MKRPVKILFVEDSDDDAKLTMRALRNGNFEPAHQRVQTAADFTAALSHEHWDAVISDFMMPGFTGIDALRIFRSSGLDIPFLLVSGTIGEETAVQAMKAGASDYLMKSNLARLAPALERELKETAMRAEHRRIEGEIYETRNFLASIFDNNPNSIFVKDAQRLLFLRVNTACEKLSGYSQREFLGKSDYDFFPKSQADAFVAKDRETLAGTREVVIAEETITCKDGTRKILHTKKFPILGKDGLAQYLVGMSEDITERKHAEQRLADSEAKFRQLIEQAGDGIFISDTRGNFVLVNSRGCELLGYTEKELIGMNGSLTYAEGEVESHTERMRAVGTGKALRFERAVRRKDGSSFPAEISVKMLDNGMVQVIFHDITERHSQEKKISRLSRIHAVLSGINAAIVRIRDRSELFREACRIIVEHGHFILGWIAVLDPATGKLTAVAQAGLPANAGADAQLFDGSVALVPGGTAEAALRQKRSAIDNQIEGDLGSPNEHDPDTMKVRRAAIALGAKSVIVLPLFVEDETFGILTLYAPERDFFDDEEVKLLDGLAGDISFGLEFIAKEEQADYLAYYDALTGLANRRLFLERVTQYMRSASGRHKLALYLIDLERFKNINDSLGRPAGDALLKQVAEWLMRNAGDASVLARLSADHFAVVIPEVADEGEAARIVERTMEALLQHPFRLNDAVFRISGKAGVTLFPSDGADADALFRNAEAALKKAKTGGDRFLFYTQKMTEKVAGNLTMENQLRQALDNEEFVLHYQAKINLASGKITGTEALIRWNDPRTGLVPPGRFIPILEETGLIHEVGRWAMRKAIEDYLRWRNAGLAAVRIAVNVSPLQLRHRDFIAEVRHAIGVEENAADGLELEITESLIMEDVKHSIASLKAIRAMGVCVAIDDFGTGFSSLSYLARLPVDILKIDRSFIVDMTAGPEGLALVSTIISMAHALKLKVVAEGVETEEQSRLLRQVDCDEMQGYLFSKPVPADVFETRFLPRRDADGMTASPGASKEKRRIGALAIEDAINAQASRFKVTAPSCKWKFHGRNDGDEGADILLTRKDGKGLPKYFSALELEVFPDEPMQTTLSAVRHIGVWLGKGRI